MKTTFLHAAQSEFDDAIDYYDQRRSGLGFEFAEEVEQALQRINHYPEAWSPLRCECAVVSSIDFPTVSYTKIGSEIIIIVAIQHHHEKPESWRSRVIE